MTVLAPDRLFIIAEMAGAHAGDAERAARIIDAAADAGADAVKVHLYTPDELAVPSFSYYPLYQQLQFAPEVWQRLVAQAHARGLQVVADVFGVDSANAAVGYGIDGFKVHTADVTNRGLLERLGASGRPILVSVGGSTWVETAEALTTLRDAGAETLVLMPGFQGYPTALEHSFLRRIQALRAKFQLPVGYASHADGGSDEAGWLPVLAAAAGADVIEVHVTVDREARGPDYQSSFDPAPLASVVQRLRAFTPALGPATLDLSDAERHYRAVHKKFVVATGPLHPGDVVTADHIGLKRTGEPPTGQALDVHGVLGRRLTREVATHAALVPADLRARVVATLACRAESGRLYGKPMQPVGDRPIIQHLIDRLRRVPIIDDIVLAISDGPSRAVFIDYAERQGLKYVVGPEKDVLGRLIMAADAAGADIAIRTTTENPYVYWENLETLVREHIELGMDLTVTEKLPLGAFLEVISVSALKRSHAFGEDRHRSELCTLFIAENPGVFGIRRVPAPPEVEGPDLRLTVDTPQDLMLVRALWSALTKPGHLITIEDIVAHLRAHPDLARLNAGENTLYLWK